MRRLRISCFGRSNPDEDEIVPGRRRSSTPQRGRRGSRNQREITQSTVPIASETVVRPVAPITPTVPVDLSVQPENIRMTRNATRIAVEATDPTDIADTLGISNAVSIAASARDETDVPSEYLAVMTAPRTRPLEELQEERKRRAAYMRTRREGESAEIAQRRRISNRNAMRVARIEQSEEQRSTRTAANRDAMRATRNEETDEQRNTRRQADRDATRTARNEETDEQRNTRRQADRDATRTARNEETDEQRNTRRQADRDATRTARNEETDEQRNTRRQADRDATRTARNEETDEQRNTRRQADRDATRTVRNEETDEQRNTRRQADRDATRTARNEETDEQRNTRRQSDTSAHRDQRQSQTPQLRAAGLLARRNQRRNTAIYAGFAGQPYPPLHYLGRLDRSCSHCGAKFFAGEFPRYPNGTYNPCCRQGSVTLDIFPNYPPTLYDLFTGDHPLSKNFMECIRQFNSALSIASMNVHLNTPPGRGPPVFKAHGAICYEAGPAIPQPGRQPAYGQLFFIDETSAGDARIAHAANKKCDPRLLRELSTLIRSDHEYAMQYKTLQEVYDEEEKLARQQNRPMNQVRITFLNEQPDPRRYNHPRIAEVAVVYVGQDGELPTPREYTISARGGGLRKIPLTEKMLDPCTYPLFFLKGDYGWHPKRRRTTQNGETQLTQKDWYSYYLCARDTFNPIHCGRRLFQQFVVGSWANVEQCRLDYIRRNQPTLRSEYFSELRDFIADGADGQTGERILLPATFTSSPRYLIASYQDAMAITSRYGKPDIFLTFTCNPKWKEIQDNLFPGQTATDRPDLIARVFRMKVAELKKDLMERSIFGRVTAYIYTVEWQKRGLPHVHWLITLAEDDKPRTADDVDRIISAELPDGGPIFERVSAHMIHRDCGPGSPCWKDNSCSKKFPKPFKNETDMDVEGFPAYRRRNDGSTVWIGQPGSDDVQLYNNQWVVPYNGYLLLKYDAHINVELCTLLHAVKYLYKYVYKGSDKASLELKQQRRNANGGIIDEVAEHLDARYVCSPEAFHRLFAFDTHDKSNAVIALAVHEKGKQKIVFQPGEEQRALDRNRKTSLLAFFAFNLEARELEAQGRLDELGPVDPRTVYYHQFPEHFTFEKANGKWKKKGRHNNNIGRVHTVTPQQRERYCIRLLLHHTKGATSFEELFTVDGVEFATAFDAAKELGLIQTDDHFDQAMRDSAFFRMPSALRTVFASLLAFDEPTNVDEMWEKWKKEMSEDYVHRGRTVQDAEALAYFDILEQFPGFKDLISAQYSIPTGMGEEDVDHAAIAQEMWDKMNLEQDEAVKAALGYDGDQLIFIDGPGGTGKTFCYEIVYHVMKSPANNKSVICCAWSGIAANLLPEGRTVASLFKLDIQQNCERSRINTSRKNADAEALRKADIFIIDECSMLSVQVLNTIDTLLRDCTGVDAPFGGKTILLGGDFRQVLPIPNKLLGQDPYSICLKQSPYFQEGNPVTFRRFELKQNMRAEAASTEFKEWLLRIGEDREPKDENGCIEIPPEYRSSGDLIEEIFENCFDDPDHLSARAILAPKNSDVDKINKEILDRMPGQTRVFLSADSVVEETADDQLRLTDEFLNSLNPTGLPPHRLELKIGAVVMLIRNLSVRKGLCNGTRLQVERFHRRNAIQCKFINGARKGKSVIIPRIDLLSNKGKGMSFVLKRRQFPLKLAFGMTINKSQGQSLEKVGVHLASEVFTHGQLYVAFSRAKNPEGLKVLAENGKVRVLNVVDRRVL